MAISEIYRLFLSSNGVITDTRQIKEKTIFFGIKGPVHDGNAFADEALAKGCMLAIIDNPSLKKDERYVLVKNSLICLQELAAYHRKQLKIPVIAITGSNGKTTTKELVSRVLGKKFNVFSTVGNLNNHIGVPLSILSIEKKDDFAIIEMGANHPGEIDFLCSIAQPGFGIITNIGKAHIGEAGGLDEIIKMKSELYRHIGKVNGKVFVNADNPLLVTLAAGIDSVLYSSHTISSCRGSIIESLPFLKIEWNGKRINTRLIGDINFENALASICIGAWLGVDEKSIISALESYLPENNRGQYVEKTPHDNSLILDAYNANPTSMEAMISCFIKWGNGKAGNKTVILGEMLELGQYAVKEHIHALELCLFSDFNFIFIIGKFFSEAFRESGIKDKRIVSFSSTSEASAYFKNNNLSGCTILLKGSRANKLELLRDVL